MCGQFVVDPSSAVFRQQSGDMAGWTKEVQLLASIANAVRTLSWQWGGDKDHPPEPILPPGVEQPKRGDRFGDARMTLAETRDWLGW